LQAQTYEASEGKKSKLDESYDEKYGVAPQSDTLLETPTAYSRRLPLHKQMKKLAEHHWFRSAIYVGVILSASCMGLEVERPQYSNLWLRVDTGVTFLYSVDCSLKLYVYGHNYFFIHGNRKKLNLWNIGDLAVTMSSIMYLGLERLNLSNDYKATASLVKMARILRIFRLFLIRKELMLIVEGFLASLVSMFWVFVVLAVMTYAFAIFCANMIGRADYTKYSGTFDKEDLFGTITRSMLTLFSVLIISEWDSVVRPLYEVQPVLVPFFVAYTVFVTFGMMNVVVGILVETVQGVQQAHRDKALNAQKRSQCELFQQMVSQLQKASGYDKDLDDSAGITETEFLKFASERQEFLEVYKSIDFPHQFSAEDLYLMLDESGDSLVTPGEFITGMFRLVHGTDFQRACMLQCSFHRFKKVLTEEQLDLTVKVDELVIEVEKDRKVRLAKQAAAAAVAAAAAAAEEEAARQEPSQQQAARIQYFKQLSQVSNSDRGNILGDSQEDRKGHMNQEEGREDGPEFNLSQHDTDDPLRVATLKHCQAEVAKARKDVQIKGGGPSGLPAGYWSPDSGIFTRKEENFLVRAKLLEAVTSGSAKEMKTWLFHAQNIGIPECDLELEYAYGAKLVHNSVGAWASSQRVVDSLDQGEWGLALQNLVDISLARKASREDLAEAFRNTGPLVYTRQPSALPAPKSRPRRKERAI